uniref:Uncharacterized protein n=1 Tax=Mycena chlorophos TaxID=658473 RepID=A0ABQ0L5P4_MYCCL|nr:predicted protein [Mycena chlorophos]
MAAPTHFRSIFFQGAPEIFGPDDRTRRDGLVNALIAANAAKYNEDVRTPPDAATQQRLADDVGTAKENLIAFDNEFGAAAFNRQLATKQRVNSWVANVQAALTQFVVPGPAPANIAAADTLYIASIPEFGLNAYVDPVDAAVAGANGSNPIPSTLEAYIVQQLRTMLTTNFHAFKVVFAITCCSYGVLSGAVQTIPLATDPSTVRRAVLWPKIGGISQITVITSAPAVPTKRIPKTQFADADRWRGASFINLFPINYASDPRPARLRFEVTFPGGTVALGFTTCADGVFEKHKDVNLCVYLSDTFPIENFADSTNSFVLNDQRSPQPGPLNMRFRAGFYRMYDKSTLPATWETDPDRLENVLRTSVYAGTIPANIVAAAKASKTQTWKYCYYEGRIDPNNHFFPPGPPHGPVICRPSEWIPVPPRTPASGRLPTRVGVTPPAATPAQILGAFSAGSGDAPCTVAAHDHDIRRTHGGGTKTPRPHQPRQRHAHSHPVPVPPQDFLPQQHGTNTSNNKQPRWSVPVQRGLPCLAGHVAPIFLGSAKRNNGPAFSSSGSGAG